MKREIKKHGGKEDSDPSAYGPWDADYKSRKAGKGKKVETKPSKYTKKFKDLYSNEGHDFEGGIVSYDNFNEELELAAYEVFLEVSENDTLEETDAYLTEKNSPVDKALKNKAKKSGMPLGILRQVFSRGLSAWKKGHIPGTTPQQWALARVNSFIVGGRTTEMSDKALYKRAKASKRKRKG